MPIYFFIGSNEYFEEEEEDNFKALEYNIKTNNENRLKKQNYF